MTESNDQDLDLCPDATVLQSYAHGKIPSDRIRDFLRSHIQLCPSCRQDRKRMKQEGSHGNPNPDVLAQRLMKRQEESRRGQEEGPVPGSVWRAIAESDKERYGPLLMVLGVDEPAQDGTVRVAEVSEQINQAIDTDYVLEPRESGLRFLCMVRAGNLFATKGTNLKTFVGRLPEPLGKRVIDFCSTAESLNDQIPLSQIEFLQDAHGNRLMRREGITSGMLVTADNDPRLGFLEQSKARTAYLSMTSPEPLSEKVVRIDRKKTFQWFVKRMLPLAAMIAVAVVGSTVLFKSQGKTSRERPDLGYGMPSRPILGRLEIRNPRDLSSVREVTVLGTVDAGGDGSAWLLNRASSQMSMTPAYLLSSHYSACRGLSYAFFPADQLLSNDSHTIDWTCDSIVIPADSQYEKPIYGLALESLISLALDQSPEQMSAAYTEATAQWVLRYCSSVHGDGSLIYSKEMVEDFRKKYEGLYTRLARPAESESHADDKLVYWDRIMTEILAQFPNEAANVQGRDDRCGLPQGPIRLVLFTLVAMEAFPDLANEVNFSRSHGVPQMYGLSTQRLRLALEGSLGSAFEDKKKLAKKIMADLLAPKGGRRKLNSQDSERIVVTDWGTVRGN